MKYLAGFIALGLMVSCSTTLPVNYIPSSSFHGQGAVTVAHFRYLPAENGSVAPNQFQKNPSGLGQEYTSEDVATIVEKALKKELAYSGFLLEGPNAPEIAGAVTRFYVDWVGLSQVTFEVGIAFEVRKGGKAVLKYSAFSRQAAPKNKSMSQQPEAIRAAISACIDAFLLEAHVKGVL